MERFSPEFIDKLVKKERKGYLLEINVGHPEILHKHYNELPYFAERMKTA